MKIKTKNIGLRHSLLTGILSVSILGGLTALSNPVLGIGVRTGANLDRGISRISVDLRDFVKRDFRNRRINNTNCRGDLESGQLVIRCDLSNYVEGGGYFQFSE